MGSKLTGIFSGFGSIFLQITKGVFVLWESKRVFKMCKVSVRQSELLFVGVFSRTAGWIPKVLLALTFSAT